MNDLIKRLVEDEFASKAQQRLFFAKAKNSKKWREWAKGKAEDTNFDKLPEKVKKEKSEEEKEQMINGGTPLYNDTDIYNKEEETENVSETTV